MTRLRLILLLAMAASVFALNVGPAVPAGCDRTWNGSVSSAWDDPANWTPVGVPDSTQHVCTPAVAGRDEILVGAGGQAASVTGDEPIRLATGTLSVPTGQVGSLTVEGGTLQVSGQELLVTSALRITGGTLWGVGTGRVATDPAATLDIAGATSLQAITLDVRGSGSWTGSGTSAMGDSAQLLVTGSMDFAAAGGTEVNNSSCCSQGPPKVTIAPGGSANRSVAGAMHFNFGWEVDGAAAPTVGEIRAWLTDTSTGALGGTGAGVFTVTGGSGAIGAGTTVPGHVRFAGGTTSIADGATVTGPAAGRLQLAAGGQLGGSGGIDLDGTLDLSGGYLFGTGATTVDKFELSGSPHLHDRQITVTGAGAWTGEHSVPSMTGTAAIDVAGTFDMRPTANTTTGEESFINEHVYGYWTNSPVVRALVGGTITRSVGGMVRSNIPFDVDGSLAPADGEIRLNGGLRDTSTGAFGGAGLVNVNGGNGGTIGDGAAITGKLRFSNGTTVLEGDIAGTGAGEFEMAGGTVTGPGNVDLPGKLILRGGDLLGSGTTTVSGELSITDSPFLFDRTVHLTSAGTGAWTSSPGTRSIPTIKGAAKLIISGTLDMRAGPDAAGEPSFFNTHRYGWWDPDSAVIQTAPGGEITRSVDGLVYSDVPFENDGALRPAQGTIRLAGGLSGTSTGQFGGDGETVIAGGQSGVIGDGAQIVGRLQVANGITSLAGTVGGSADGVLEIVGGTLTGTGDLDFPGELALRGGDFTGDATATVRGRLSMSGHPFFHNRTVHVAPGATGEWTGTDSVVTIKGDGQLLISGTLDMRPEGSSRFDSHRYGWWDPDAPSVRVAPGGQVLRSVPGELGSNIAFDMDGEIAPSENAAFTLSAGSGDAWTGRVAGAGKVRVGAYNSSFGAYRLGEGLRVAGRMELAWPATVEGTTTVEPGGVLRQESTLDGTGALLVNGTLEFAGGSHGGTGLTRIEPDGRLEMLASTTIDRRTIHNRGETVHGGSNGIAVVLRNDARFENAGILRLNTTAQNGGGWTQMMDRELKPLFRNQGVIEVALPAAAGLSFDMPVENDGEIRLRGGRLDVREFEQTPDGVVDAELRQDAQGTAASHLNFGDPQNTRLAGTLRVRVPQGETPTAGQTWNVTNGWSQVGNFDRVVTATPVDGIHFDAAPGQNGSIVVSALDATAAPSQANLAVTEVEPGPAPEDPGTQVYRFAVTNAGPGPAPDATLEDLLSDDLALVSASTETSPCAMPGNDRAVCALGRLAAGDKTIVEVVARPTGAGEGTQTVEVSSAAAEVDPADNRLVVETPADEPVEGPDAGGSEPPAGPTPETPAGAEDTPRDSVVNRAPTMRARTLGVRSGRVLRLRGERSLMRTAHDADGDRLTFAVVRRGRRAGRERVRVRRDGRVRIEAPRRATTFWVEVVAIDSAGARSRAARIRIVVS